MTLPKSYYNVNYQTGNGLKPFRGPAFQRGYGLGGFFKGLARSFAPVLKKGLVKVGKKALKTGVQVFHDVSQGKSVKESIKRRGKQSINDMFADIRGEIKNKAISRKRASNVKGSTLKRRKKDIFD